LSAVWKAKRDEMETSESSIRVRFENGNTLISGGKFLIDPLNMSVADVTSQGRPAPWNTQNKTAGDGIADGKHHPIANPIQAKLVAHTLKNTGNRRQRSICFALVAFLDDQKDSQEQNDQARHVK
jgi:hypothetical protein